MRIDSPEDALLAYGREKLEMAAHFVAYREDCSARVAVVHHFLGRFGVEVLPFIESFWTPTIRRIPDDIQ